MPATDPDDDDDWEGGAASSEDDNLDDSPQLRSEAPFP
jgi:hypothetical protein